MIFILAYNHFGGCMNVWGDGACPGLWSLRLSVKLSCVSLLYCLDLCCFLGVQCFTAYGSNRGLISLQPLESLCKPESFSCTIYSCETGLCSRCLHRKNTVLHSRCRLQGLSSGRTHTQGWGLFFSPLEAGHSFTCLTVQPLFSGKCFIRNSAPSQRSNSVSPLQSVWRIWTKWEATCSVANVGQWTPNIYWLLISIWQQQKEDCVTLGH